MNGRTSTTCVHTCELVYLVFVINDRLTRNCTIPMTGGILVVVVVRTKYSKSYTSFTKLVYLKVAVAVVHTINIDGETNPFENDFFRKIEYFQKCHFCLKYISVCTLKMGTK